jgi:ammonium transporter, Amt family
MIDVNAQYAGFEYHYTYLVFCGFIVWLIIPGIGLLYGGLARQKSALALLFQPEYMVGAVTTFQWMLWGYSWHIQGLPGLSLGTWQISA